LRFACLVLGVRECFLHLPHSLLGLLTSIDGGLKLLFLLGSAAVGLFELATEVGVIAEFPSRPVEANRSIVVHGQKKVEERQEEPALVQRKGSIPSGSVPISDQGTSSTFFLLVDEDIEGHPNPVVKFDLAENIVVSCVGRDHFQGEQATAPHVAQQQGATVGVRFPIQTDENSHIGRDRANSTGLKVNAQVKGNVTDGRTKGTSAENGVEIGAVQGVNGPHRYLVLLLGVQNVLQRQWYLLEIHLSVGLHSLHKPPTVFERVFFRLCRWR
jgi:hypothetical protein